MEDQSRRTVLAALASAGAVAAAGCQSLPRFDATNDCPAKRDPNWAIDGRHWGPPTVDGDRLLVSEGYTATGGGPYRIASIEQYSGQEQWVYNVENAGAGVPAAVGDSVYVGTGEDRVLAFDAELGHLRWAYDAGGREEYGGGAWGRPAVVDDLVVVGVSHSDRRNADPTDPAEYAHRVVALDRADGSERWAVAVDRTVLTGPAVAGDVVVAASKGGTVYGLGVDGTKRWERSLDGGVRHRPVAGDGEVYVATDEGTVAALAAESGAGGWSETLDATCSAVAADDASLLVGTADGTVVALGRDGTRRWRYDAGAHVADVVSNAAQTWVFDRCGVVHRLNAATGEREHRFRIGECDDGETCNRSVLSVGTGIELRRGDLYLTGPWVRRYQASEEE